MISLVKKNNLNTYGYFLSDKFYLQVFHLKQKLEALNSVFNACIYAPV